MEDIIRNVVDIDKQFGDSDSFLPCTFTVADLNMLPTKKPGAIDDVTLLYRATRLERQMADVQAAGQRPAYTDVVRRPTGSHTGRDERHESVAPSTDRQRANEVARPASAETSASAGESPCSAITPLADGEPTRCRCRAAGSGRYILPPEQERKHILLITDLFPYYRNSLKY